MFWLKTQAKLKEKFDVEVSVDDELLLQMLEPKPIIKQFAKMVGIVLSPHIRVLFLFT